MQNYENHENHEWYGYVLSNFKDIQRYFIDINFWWPVEVGAKPWAQDQILQ